MKNRGQSIRSLWRSVLGMVFTVFLVGMFTLAFNIQKAGASEPATEWTKTYGGANPDQPYSVVQTSDGGYALAGFTESFGAGGSDFWLVKVDSSGNEQWNQTYGTSKFDEAYSVVQTHDGGYALAGGAWWSAPPSWKFWLVKVDSSGNMEWSKEIDGGDHIEIAYSVVQTDDGGYALLGETWSLGAGWYDFWLVKVGPPPSCQVSPDTLDFNVVTVGSYLDKPFTISNIGEGTLTGDVSESCDHYSIVAGEGAFTLAAGESLTVTVRFEPVSAGQHSCTIETGSALCSDVSCTGVGEWAAKIELTPPSHHFFTVKVGNCSEEKEFYLESIGTQTATGTLHITDGDAGNFVITEPDTLDFSLPPEVTLTIKVKFCPESRGDKTANLLADGANCNDCVSSLDGYGWKRTYCPYVSGWNGEKLVRDNNILPQSEQVDTDEDVTDYYLLRVPLQPKSTEYHVRIEEFENEHTYADRFELAIIDHPRDLHLGVTDDGEVFTYLDLMAPKEVTSSLGVDHYELITQADGRSARIQANEIVILNFGPVNSPYGARLVVDMKTDHTDVPGQTSFRKAPLISYNDANPPQDVLLCSRENRAVTVGDVTSLLPSDGQDFIIKLYFPAGHSVDFIGLDLSEKVALEVKRISLASAIHSKDGAVTSKLSLTDGVYAELIPGEQMELFFKAPEERTEHRRDFILISRGHYFKYSRSSRIPQKFILAQNYPNPFNATTEINYALPEDCCVKLEVYDILGHRVTSLVNQRQTVGYKFVRWDASSSASGIYFYRLQAGDFVETRKMILLK